MIAIKEYLFFIKNVINNKLKKCFFFNKLNKFKGK